MCVIFQPILRLFLVMISTEACRVSLGIVPAYAYKLQSRRTTYLGDYPTPAGHSLATVWIVWWLLTRLLVFCVFRFSRFLCFFFFYKYPMHQARDGCQLRLRMARSGLMHWGCGRPVRTLRTFCDGRAAPSAPVLHFLCTPISACYVACFWCSFAAR